VGSCSPRFTRRYHPINFEQIQEEAMDRLKNKVILISGGARGQGAAEARLFVAEGARVIIGDVVGIARPRAGCGNSGNPRPSFRMTLPRKSTGNARWMQLRRWVGCTVW
jgi:hypothetical protein